MIDTHCHLNYSEYDNLDELIVEMRKNNIYCIINGCDTKSNEEAIALSKKHNNVYVAIGYHPSEIDKIEDDYFKCLENNFKEVVAIGEIGLDYHYVKDNKDSQCALLESQLQFAEDKGLPVIIHNREATGDILNILSRYRLKGVIHAFSGSYETAMNFINLGYKLGIGGVVTFKNSKLHEVVSKISIEDIVLETDSPYLTPEPNRGKQNSPLNLKYIAQRIADIKNISYEDVISITSQTANMLFDLHIDI